MENSKMLLCIWAVMVRPCSKICLWTSSEGAPGNENGWYTRLMGLWVIYFYSYLPISDFVIKKEIEMKTRTSCRRNEFPSSSIVDCWKLFLLSLGPQTPTPHLDEQQAIRIIQPSVEQSQEKQVLLYAKRFSL